MRDREQAMLKPGLNKPINLQTLQWAHPTLD